MIAELVDAGYAEREQQRGGRQIRRLRAGDFRRAAGVGSCRTGGCCIFAADGFAGNGITVAGSAVRR